MESDKLEEICCERLQRWTFKLLTEHSTPAILIGIGHDHKSGQITVCVPENFSDFEIKAILRATKLFLNKEDPFR